jgi:hypothetical protein
VQINDEVFPTGSLIGYGPRLIKRRSQVRIPLPFPCVDMHVKKKKKINDEVGNVVYGLKKVLGPNKSCQMAKLN